MEIEGETLRVPAPFATQLKTALAKQRERLNSALELVHRQAATAPGPATSAVVPTVPAPPASEPEFDLPDSQLLVTDPNRYNAELKANMTAALRRQEERITLAQRSREQQVQAAQTQAQRMQLLRDGFYATHPSFKGSETLTDLVMERKWREVTQTGRIETMKVGDAYQEIAAEVRELSGVATRIAAQKPPTLEGSAPRKPPAPPADDTVRAPKTLSDGIRELKKRHGQRRFSMIGNQAG